MSKTLPIALVAAVVLVAILAILRERPSNGRPPRPGTSASTGAGTGAAETRDAPAQGGSDGGSTAEHAIAPSTGSASGVSGSVRSEDGSQPLGAMVHATPRKNPETTQKLLVGQDGRFSLELPPGEWLVRAEGREARSRTTFVALAPGAWRDDLVLELVPSATIHLIVHTFDGGRAGGAVARTLEVQVQNGAYHIGGGDDLVTDDRGEYTGPLIAGTHRLCVRKKGYGPATATVNLSPGSTTTCEVTVPRGVSISGHTVERSGQVIAGARVTGAPQARDDPIAHLGVDESRGVSGPDGRFLLEDLAEGVHHTVSAQADGYQRGYVQGILPGGAEVTVVLDPLCRQRIRIVRAGNGDPVRSALLASLDGLDERGNVTWSGRGGEERLEELGDGLYVLSNLKPGFYTLTVQAEGLPTATSPRFQTETGKEGDEVRIEMHSGVVLSGLVVAAGTRAPIEGADVEVREAARMGVDGQPSTSTDGQGRFEVPGLGPGAHVVSVRHPGWVPEERQVDVKDGTTIEFLLQKGGVIEGAVRSDPLPEGASLLIRATGAGDSLEAEVDGRGQYRIEGVRPGTWTVSCKRGRMVVHANMRFWKEEGDLGDRVVEVPDRATVRVDFPDDSGGAVRLRGTVRKGGTPLASVPIRIRGQGTLEYEGGTGIDGTYVIERVLPGTYTVRIDHVAMRCVVPAGTREVRQDFDMPEARVVGRVLEERTSAPVAGARVSFYFAKESELDMLSLQTCTTGEDGRFAMEGLASGSYAVVASRSGFGAAMATSVEVPSAGQLALPDLKLPVEARIEGRVLDADGRPIPEADISPIAVGASGAFGPVWVASSDAEGAYHLVGLPPGEYRLSVHHSAGTFEVGPVRIMGGGTLAVELRAPRAK